MSSPYLKYRTFEQLLSDVAVDFPVQYQEGMMEPAQLIKVAQRVTYDLGLRIHQEKTAIVEVQRRKARMPDDFYVLNFAAIREDGLCAPVKLKSGKDVACDCPNLGYSCENEASVRDGWMYTNFDCGNLFLSYMGNMEDEDGNLLVPDQPFLNEYYEYAIKQRLLENMAFMGEPVADKIGLIEQRLRAARNNALTLVNTPDFQEMKQVIEGNRRYMLNRYYHIFR